MSDSNVRLGIAPIGWTNDDMPELGAGITFEQCVSEMALAGFEGCEVGNRFPRDPKELKAALDLRGLQVCNAWFSCHFVTGKREETIEDFLRQRDFLHAVGARIIGASEQGHSVQGQMNTPVLEAKPVFSDKEWELVCEGLNRLGELAAEAEMTLTYHHHMGTGIQTAAEIDRLMAGTDPERVFLLYDTGHLYFSGEDHLAVLDRYGERIRHVHLKDVRGPVLARLRAERWSFLKGVLEGVFTVPGDGEIDFVPVFERLAALGYRGWWVVEAEQDPARANPLEYALKARRYIREKSGV
jgi:inosose dehydratase